MEKIESGWRGDPVPESEKEKDQKYWYGEDQTPWRGDADIVDPRTEVSPKAPTGREKSRQRIKNRKEPKPRFKSESQKWYEQNQEGWTGDPRPSPTPATPKEEEQTEDDGSVPGQEEAKDKRRKKEEP